MGRIIPLLLIAMMLISLESASQLHSRAFIDSPEKKFSLKVLPQNFYNSRLGFFCRKEVQVQKALRLPIYFRLGSKDYFDRRTELRFRK